MNQGSALTLQAGNTFKRLGTGMGVLASTRLPRSIDVLQDVTTSGKAAYNPSEETELYRPPTPRQLFKTLGIVFHMYQGLIRGKPAVLVNTMVYSRQQHQDHSVLQPSQLIARAVLRDPKGLNWMRLTQVGV